MNVGSRISVRQGGDGRKSTWARSAAYLDPMDMLRGTLFGLMAIFIVDIDSISNDTCRGSETMPIIAVAEYVSSMLFFRYLSALVADRRDLSRRARAHDHRRQVCTKIAGQRACHGFCRLLGDRGLAYDCNRAAAPTSGLSNWPGARSGGFYLEILLPTLPMLSISMTSSAVMRSVGDARRTI